MTISGVAGHPHLPTALHLYLITNSTIAFFKAGPAISTDCPWKVPLEEKHFTDSGLLRHFMHP
jgi:hypothetical protein